MFLIRYLLCIIVNLCTIINPIIMNEVVSFNQVEKKIIKLRNVKVIIDSDVAELCKKRSISPHENGDIRSLFVKI